MLNFIKVFILVMICSSFAYAQTPVSDKIAAVPETLIVEGIPKLPKAVEDDFRASTQWQSSNFIGWRRDGSLIGYSLYYQPFFMQSPLGEKQVIETVFPDPSVLALQPVNEKSFLYVKDFNGDEFTQLYRFDIDTKQSVQLTTSPEIEFVNSFLWSPEGNSVYFLNQKKKEDAAEIYVENPETKQLKRLATLEGDAHYIVDVDSNYLVFAHYLSNNHIDYYLLDLKTSKITRLTNEDAYFQGAKFSSVNNGLWWLSNNKSDFLNLCFYDLKTKKVIKVNNSELNITDFAFSPNEKFLALKINESGSDALRIFEMRGTQINREIAKPELSLGVIEKMAWRDDDELGFSFQSVAIPPTIKTYNVKTGGGEVWGKDEIKTLIADKLQEPKLIKWKSFDDKEITGFILAAKQKEPSQKLPVLIDLHGGPKEQFQPYFNPYGDYYAAKLQIAIIYPNVRGSSGFGKNFENLDNKEKREDAVKDLQALIDWIAAQPDLDASRIIIKGTSYGGFLALALGLKEQNRIKGVIAEVPPVSIKNYINKSVKSLQEIYAFEYGQTSDETLMAKTESLSLLNNNNLDNWKIPVLLTAGQNDVRVPVEDIDKLKDEMKSKGIPVWYLKATNEGHSWSDYKNSTYLELSKIVFIVKFGELQSKSAK